MKPSGTPASQDCFSCFHARSVGAEEHPARVTALSALSSFVARLVRVEVA